MTEDIEYWKKKYKRSHNLALFYMLLLILVILVATFGLSKMSKELGEVYEVLDFTIEGIDYCVETYTYLSHEEFIDEFFYHKAQEIIQDE